ncbi:MAG: Magnesium and cobalt efflux protein CorC [Chlamydiae bacterium]|nr:Magnesium and cobalt efflux protein CorC [Chlamydiota bacterium]
MIESPIFALIFLIGSSFITGITSAMQMLGKAQAETLAAKQKGPGKFLFKKTKRNSLTYSLSLTKNILLICYAFSAFAFILSFFSGPPILWDFIFLAFAVLALSLIADTLMRALSLTQPRTFFKATCQIVSLYLLPFYPLALLFYKILRLLPTKSSFHIKDKILEILHDSEFTPYLDPNDQKLILSVVSFKERIAREVMVPRVDMFTLPAETTVKEAAVHFLEEKYSRIPVWKDNVDNVIGTLYYKDLLNIYLNASKELERPVEKLLKPIVYTPETKKISQLLQEFRSKQIHLAIVVDEYGGTEGIVTIEDILEELVGEIADETDYDEEALYTPLPSGGWIVDAKMTIIDIEEELSIEIPQSPEYDTLGGFIFHKAGTIPSKGWRLHQDVFDLEVLSSSERTIEQIRITPH